MKSKSGPRQRKVMYNFWLLLPKSFEVLTNGALFELENVLELGGYITKALDTHQSAIRKQLIRRLESLPQVG